MSQLSEQTDLSTDSYTMDSSASIPTKSSLTMDKKKMLGISAATLLLGGSAWAISQKIVGHKEPAAENGSTSSDATASMTLPADIDVAGKTTDSMTFEQAFETAREEVGMGGVFSWHGHWYNTFEKEEWSDLSLTQRQEYTEMITGEHLPVKPYAQPVTHIPGTTTTQEPTSEPTIIEGHLNGQRIMGLDFDHDGIIDTMVLDGADGNTYRVVDATGDDGLDTIYRYDSLDGELTAAVRLDHPIVLSNDQFNQGLEESMSKEIVDSILEPEPPTSTVLVASHEAADLDEPTTNHETHAADTYDDDDTYINDGNVQDMDE
ncbi:hypothetical protein [Spirosoma foliorum]|uniref:Uncharacterized protein n=1 Tax=Spirosoma foliorum TaxID=2710596 RepID=A0A7G5GMW8_9BACT|nr:hypothetical protein [Spirosoma foliorum]QMW00210.1 hypothetical protein H3H32_19485 [Spirosoma foliorum]